jgi:hypothetical protein
LEKGLSPIVASELATMCNVLRKPVQYFLPTHSDTVLGECLADPIFDELMMFYVRMTPNVWSGRALQEGSLSWVMRSCINVSGL